MATEKKTRPPVPPKNKLRSFSDRSQSVSEESFCFESRSFKTLDDRPVSKHFSSNNTASAENMALSRQALPPEDCMTFLDLPPVEPQMFLEDEAPVFYSSSSLPSKSSHGGSFQNQYVGQNSNDGRSKSIPDHLEEMEVRRFSDTISSTSTLIVEEFNDYYQSYSSASQHSVSIEPSPQRTLGPSSKKGFASDPDLTETPKPRSILGSDPEDCTGSISSKGIKGRDLRPNMLMLSKSTNALASLQSPEERAKKGASPEKKKIEVEKLNRFFGESKETATDLEANIYHMLISSNQLRDSSSASADGTRTKKSASTWFLSQKALESLPEKPLDAQVPRTKRMTTDELLSALKLKDGITERGRKIMKSFKRRVAGVALNDGNSPAEEVHGTFEIPLERCVMSSENKFVPLVVEKCVSVIEEQGLHVEGIYRLSGNGLAITELQEELDKEPLEMSSENERWNEVHIVSNLLKLFFRKLPNSLITDELYESVIFVSRIEHREKRLLKLKLLLKSLPKVNYETFKFLSRHLHNVASNWTDNKMDAHNLAIMFGPTLIRSPKDQTLTMIKDMNNQTTVVETIIKHCDWLFGGWSEDQMIPSDESSLEANTRSPSNLKLLASAETLVARQLPVLPAEEESSSFFSFQGAHRRSKRKHRNKSIGKDTPEGTEQTVIPDVEREIELRRVKFPDLPFKSLSSPFQENEPFHKTLFNGRTKVKRSSTDRLDAKTLDIKLVSNKLEEMKESMENVPDHESTRRDSEKQNASDASAETGTGSESNVAVIEIKKYRAYDFEDRMATLSQNATVQQQQPTLLRKFSSRSQLIGCGLGCGLDNGSLKKGSAVSLSNFNSLSSASAQKETQRPAYGSPRRQTDTVGYHPDVSQLALGGTSEGENWENGSLEKRTNIVVRGPLGRRYCVLSGTDPSVFTRGMTSGDQLPKQKRRQVAEYLSKLQCAMTCVINVKMDVIRPTGPDDIELRRVSYK